jgi:hypothetical protein
VATVVEGLAACLSVPLASIDKGHLPPDVEAWKELLADPDLRRARNAAEAHLLWELRQALRRGSLFIPHSLDYRSRDALFNLESTTVRAPGSARTAPEFLDQLCAHLEVALENLDEAIWFQDLKIDGTKIRQHPWGPKSPRSTSIPSATTYTTASQKSIYPSFCWKSMRRSASVGSCSGGNLPATTNCSIYM